MSMHHKCPACVAHGTEDEAPIIPELGPCTACERAGRAYVNALLAQMGEMRRALNEQQERAQLAYNDVESLTMRLGSLEIRLDDAANTARKATERAQRAELQMEAVFVAARVMRACIDAPTLDRFVSAVDAVAGERE
jgi:hypothetical protein